MDPHEDFERLYREHAEAVFAFALRRSNHAQAEDVVAETFLVAWRRLGDIPFPARPWLLGVARRVLANHYRTEARRQALTGRLVEATAFACTAPAADADLPVMRALDSLSTGDREILLLAAWDELTRAEAARVLGITPAAFAVRLHRARRRLSRARRAMSGPASTAHRAPSTMEAR